MNPLTGRKQFAQPCPKKLAGGPEFFPVNFRKRIENVKKVLKKIFRRKTSYGHVEDTSDNPSRKNWEKPNFWSLSFRKERRKKFKTFFQKKNFFQTVPLNI